MKPYGTEKGRKSFEYSIHARRHTDGSIYIYISNSTVISSLASIVDKWLKQWSWIILNKVIIKRTKNIENYNMLSRNPFNNVKMLGFGISRVLIDLLHCIRVHDILYIYVIKLIKKIYRSRSFMFKFTKISFYYCCTIYAATQLHMALMYSLIHIMGLFIFQLTYLLSRRKYITKFLFYFFSG